jgi:hypothetical protein
VARAGDLLQWHPHLHLITTDGGRGPDGSWPSLPGWDSVRLMRLFRERLLASLLEQRAISKELVAKLLACRHPGFSAHVGERIAPEDQQRPLGHRRLPDPESPLPQDLMRPPGRTTLDENRRRGRRVLG